MSIRKKKKEIRRLISAFESEANEFHDIQFSTYFITQETENDGSKFRSPNHAIMLWQYYGEVDPNTEGEKLFNDLSDSDFQWGLRGSKLSSFGVIEGDKCNLFVRMAKRAGSLFNEKETYSIKSKVVNEIIASEMGGKSKPTAVTNRNSLAVWLNYLLYYISEINSGAEHATRIEPDPFSLSLLALERLLEDPIIGKVDKSTTNVEDINFRVAISFSGEKRGFVSRVVDILRNQLGKDQIFYDFDYQSQLARPNLDTLLQNIYRNNSDLIVVFLCKEYEKKEWCGLEWRAIRDIIKSKENNQIMFIKFDDSNIDGVFSIDGYIDANKFTEKEISKFILERVTSIPNEYA